MHKGSVHLRFGALIGIPGSFKYRTSEDVVRASMKVNRVPVDWQTEAGSKLMSALLLSDNAKKFAYAREVMYVDSNYVFVKVGLQAGIGFSAYATGFIANRLLNLKAVLKTWARGGLYTLIGGSWCLVYILIRDMYNFHQDNKVDNRAAKLGKDYAQGGVEYYTKLLLRNQALREFMGSEGPFHYTAYGNQVSTWRTPTVQLSARRDNLIRLRQEYEPQKQD